MGNSSRNEIGSGSMKHWEIIADNLHDAGFFWNENRRAKTLLEAVPNYALYHAERQSVFSYVLWSNWTTHI